MRHKLWLRLVLLLALVALIACSALLVLEATGQQRSGAVYTGDGGTSTAGQCDQHTDAYKLGSVLPDSVIALLSPATRQRFDASAIAEQCQFQRQYELTQEAEQRWHAQGDSKAQGSHVVPIVEWMCRPQDMCGGVGDRVHGLLAVYAKCLVARYPFRVQWTKPHSMAPCVLAPRQQGPRWWRPNSTSAERGVAVEWQQARAGWRHGGRATPRRLMMHRVDDNQHDFCRWSDYDTVQINTNTYGLETQGCDADAIRKAQAEMVALHGSPLQLPSDSCQFWFLFRLGTALVQRLVTELTRLRSWQLQHGLLGSAVVALHIRSGDRAMGVGTGVRLRSTRGATLQLLACARAVVARVLGVAPGNATYVVVADTAEAKRVAHELLPPQVYASSVQPRHSDRSPAAVTSPSSVWTDLLLLATADAVVQGHASGFAHTGGSLVGMLPPERRFNYSTCDELSLHTHN